MKLPRSKSSARGKLYRKKWWGRSHFCNLMITLIHLSHVWIPFSWGYRNHFIDSWTASLQGKSLLVQAETKVMDKGGANFMATKNPPSWLTLAKHGGLGFPYNKPLWMISIPIKQPGFHRKYPAVFFRRSILSKKPRKTSGLGILVICRS